MHIESYEVFRAIEEQESITKAAQTLHMTQSTASRHLQALEQEYGALLFERSATGIALTEFGRALYPYVLELLRCQEEAKEKLTQMRRQGGTIIVGATYTIGEYILPQVLGAFRRDGHASSIRMRVHNTREVVQDLLHRRIDVGLVEGSVLMADIETRNWKNDELILVCPPEHALTKQERVTAADIVKHHLICREEGSGTRQMTMQALADAGVLDQTLIWMELGSTQAVKSTVEAGFGIAFLSHLAVAHELSLGSLVRVDVEDISIVRTLTIILRKEPHTNPAVRALLQKLHVPQ